LLKFIDDLTAGHGEMRQEQDLCRAAEARLEALKVRKEEQRRDMEEFRGQMQALAAEAARLQGGQ